MFHNLIVLCQISLCQPTKVPFQKLVANVYEISDGLLHTELSEPFKQCKFVIDIHLGLLNTCIGYKIEKEVQKIKGVYARQNDYH